MTTILLVGPWERCSAGGVNNYINYVNSLRNSIVNLKVIYSSMDPPGVIPYGIFDYILYNNIPDYLDDEKYSVNKTARLYAANSIKGLELCKDDTIIRVRSDLRIKNITAIIKLVGLIEKFPNKFAIDFSHAHNNILPFNFSDFLVVGRYENLHSLFDLPLENPKISRVSLHPFTSHIAGNTRGVMTNEQFLWYSYYCSTQSISSLKVDSFVNIIRSYLFLKRKILLINREVLFEFDEKYNSNKRLSYVEHFYPTKISPKMLLIFIAKDFTRYYIKTIQRIILKVIIWK